MKTRILRLLAFSLMLTASSIAQTQSQIKPATQEAWQRYSTPRQTIYNFIYWQNHQRLDIAAEALNSDKKLNPVERKELARKLKRALDARGLFIKMSNYPDKADYMNPLTGMQEVLLLDQFPRLTLRKYETQWLFTPEAIQFIPELYAATFSTNVEKFIEWLPAWFQKDFLGLAAWQVLALFIIILSGLLLRKLAEFLLARVADRLEKHTKTEWDDLIARAAIKPVGLFLMTGFYYLTYTNLQLGVTLNQYLRYILVALVYSSLIWLVYRLIDVLENYLTRITSATESKLDDQLVPLIRKTLKVFVVILGTIFILQNLDIDVASLLTGLGIGGLAFALAARDTLANFFGSITIFIDKPFQVGDWVVAGNIEGIVEEVGFRSTRIRTFYNSLVSVPNAKIADSAIDNLGLRQYRRLKTTLGLTYSTTAEQMQAFVDGVRAIVQANPHTRKDYYEIHFNSFGDISLNVLVYIFFKVPNGSEELQERHNILLEILKMAEAIGVEFAFPTQTLHVDSTPGKKPREAGKNLTPEQMAEQIAAFGPPDQGAAK